MPTDGGDSGAPAPRPPRPTLSENGFRWLRVHAARLLGDLLLDARRGPRALLLGGLGSAVLAGSLPGLFPWSGGGGAPELPIRAHSALAGTHVASQPPVLPAIPTAAAASPTPTVIAESDPRAWATAALLRGMPLEGHAQEMVSAADRHGIDWRLLPVIAYLESQGGLTACGGNAWGYAKCQVRFESFEEGIEATAAVLGEYGNLPSTTKLCIWVSGTGCTTTHAVDYVYRAAGLYYQLGGQIGLPAYPAEEAVAAEVAPDATTPGPAETATTAPEATPSPTESVSPEPPTAIETPTATEPPVDGTPTLVPVSGE
ncbi:MAG TPA: hypothetical protein VFY90_09620 [Tepidiformaceae bacterium]|nr:hypothetical protein [Tepidiformaceae bacterium]